jgi:thiol:disulfide interchange protein
VKRFSAFPVLGKEVDLMPYFKSRVTEVTEKDVALEFQVLHGAVFKDAIGTVTVSVAGGTITTTIKPLPGAPFRFNDAVGLITSSDGSTFTVDMNHPLAGKTIVLDLEALSVVPVTQGAGIAWVDNHDAGLAQAKAEGKPVFLILHADWCSWCKKSFSETFPDPRITALKDRFIWLRINSDKEQKYKKQYGQEGFPMMVLLNPDGSVLKKIDGYRDAVALREEIRAVLN